MQRLQQRLHPLENKPEVQRKQSVEILFRSWKIIIENCLRLNEEFTDAVFGAQVEREGQGLKLDLIIQVQIVGAVQYITAGTNRGSIGTG